MPFGALSGAGSSNFVTIVVGWRSEAWRITLDLPRKNSWDRRLTRGLVWRVDFVDNVVLEGTRGVDHHDHHGDPGQETLLPAVPKLACGACPSVDRVISSPTRRTISSTGPSLRRPARRGTSRTVGDRRPGIPLSNRTESICPSRLTGGSRCR